MSDMYIASAELWRSDTRHHTVGVTPEWGIEIDGHKHPMYAQADAVVFAALRSRIDTVVSLDELPNMVTNAYEAGLEQGANSFTIPVKKRATEFYSAVSRPVVRVALADLQSYKRGPLAGSIYKLYHLQPAAYLLCSDIRKEDLGLDSIAHYGGKNQSAHEIFFMQQRNYHIGMVMRGTKGRAKEVSPGTTAQTTPLPSVSEYLDTAEQTTRPVPSQRVVAYNRTVVTPFLKGPVGNTFNTRDFYDAMRVIDPRNEQAPSILSILDTLVVGGDLKKTVDPKDKTHFVYTVVRSPHRIR